MGVFAGPEITESGLVLALDAGNSKSYPGSGTTWTDLSGTSNATLTNGPTYSSANGGSLVFDGVDDKVTVAATGTYDFSASRITIEVWLKISSTPTGGEKEIITTDNSGDGSTWNLGFVSGFLTFNPSSWLGSTITGTAPRMTASNFALNTFNNIIVTSAGSGEVGKMYYNGVKQTDGTSTAIGLSYDAGRPIGIGLEPVTNRFAFAGNIAVVRIYKNKTFTQAEVTQNFNALRARYNILETIAWSANNINTATISGVNFTATEAGAASDSSARSTALPAVTTTGWYLDWIQVEGHMPYVCFVGVANSTANLAWNNNATKTWYWDNRIFGLSSSGEAAPGTLTAGTHRLAVRLESGSPKIYFRKGSTVTGPLVCPSGTLYFITQSLAGWKIGDITLANGGAVYEGGGGLF